MLALVLFAQWQVGGVWYVEAAKQTYAVVAVCANGK